MTAGYSYSETDYGMVEPGTKIENVRTHQDVIKNDEGELPPIAVDSGNFVPKPQVLSYDRYTDAKYVQPEIDRIWKKAWQVACREEDIPNVGDRIAYDVAGLSYVVVRSAPDEFKAFHNFCRHRGRKVCDDKDSGDHFRCGFHGWVYDLEGKLAWLPLEQAFPGVNAENSSLIEVKLERWGGNVFINPDPECGPLADALGPLTEHFADFPQGDRYTVVHVRKKIPCNWKAAQEAFNEAYHVVQTHADGLPLYGSAGTQIDAWETGDCHVSRLVTPMAIDGYIEDKLTTRDALEYYCTAYGFEKPEEGRGETEVDCRKCAAEIKQKQLEEETGRDYSGRHPTYFIDMYKYFMYPNFHPWWGEMYPWWYKFLPTGDNPEQCTMEVRILAPIPKDGKAPPSAELVELDYETSADDDRLGPIGLVLDQDMANLAYMQGGYRSAPAGHDFPVLSMWHEGQIAHFHHVWNRIMGLCEEEK